MAGLIQKNEKHEFLYQYARAAFDDELQRFRNIEDKASKYLNLLSVVIVGYTLMLRLFSEKIFSNPAIISWLIFFSIFLTYLALITSWSFLFRALKFMDMPRLPLDDNFIDSFEPKNLPTIHFALMKACNNALTYARQGNTIKSQLLIKGYRDIGLAMWALSISVALIVAANFPL